MKKKILVIDDEELIVKTMAKLLEKQNYETIVIKRGQDALVLVEEEGLDLIISDIRMPGENGIEIIKQIYEMKEEKNEKKPPVIFITGYADEKLENEARKLDPADYIYKPFELEFLLERVKSVLEQ